MSELDLKIPDHDRFVSPPQSNGSGKWVWNCVIMILLLVCATGIWLPRFTKEEQQRDVQISTTSERSVSLSDINEELIVKLKKAGAYKEAANLLGSWLQIQGISTERKAKLFNRQGELFSLAGEHGEALKAYYLCADINHGRDMDLERETNAAIIEELRKMGQYGAVSSFLTEKNRERKGDTAPTDSDPIVAKVDGKPYLMSDLDAELKKFVDARVIELTRDIKDQSEIQRIETETRKQYAAPYEKMKFLETWIQGEVLYREALAFKMEQHPLYEENLEKYKKNLLGRLLVESKVQVSDVSDLDLANYVEAHREVLGLSTDPGKLQPNQWAGIKDKAAQMYREDKARENAMIFQQEIMKRHQLEIVRDAFTRGQQ